MKTLFKVLALSLLLTAFSALAFAQEDKGAALTAEYTKFREQIRAKCGERAPALVTGKKIIETYEPKAGETDKTILEFYELNKPVIDFVKTRVATIEKEDPVCAREQAYIKAFTAKNWADVFTTGEVIINAEGDSPKGLDIKLDLVSVGFDRAYVDKNDAYNAKTMALAKSALDALNANKPSNSKKYGAFVPFETKEAAQSWMNYIIGWQMYYKMNQQKDALAYFYKAAQIGTAKKNDTSIYTNIGKYYFDEAVRLFEEYTTKRKANNNEDNDETKALLALSRGFADRATDAFGRAYKVVPAGAAKTAIAKTLTDLYKFRFNLAEAKQADVDKYVADLVAKPMPDPATAVTPVVEATPTPTTTTTSTTPTTLNTTNATTTATTTTPAATTNSTKTTTTTKTTPATKTTTTVKKPVKKKGTR
jgi:tetratricopeptide (TPR) repeat protein